MSGAQSKTKIAVGDTPIDDSKARFEQFKRDHPEWYYVLPDNPTIGERLTAPIHYTKMYWVRVLDQFGWRFVVVLCSAYFGIKGFLYALLGYGQLPYFLMHMQVDSVDYQIYGLVATTPWSMKALMGLVSDTMPIRGYLKKYYLVGFALFGGVCFLVLGLWDIPKDLAYVAAIMFFLGHFETALVDLLVEGRYAELMVKNPETSSDIVTIVWTTYFIGGLLATWTVGPLSDKYDETGNDWYLKGMFLAGAPFAVQIAVPILLNFLGETPLPHHLRGFQTAKWNKHRRIFILAIVMGIGALSLSAFSLINRRVIIPNLQLTGSMTQVPVMIYVAFIVTVMTFFAYWALPRVVANALIFKFLGPACYLSVGGPLDIFYTGSAKCTGENGPQFSNSYYISVSGTVASICGFLGVTLFQAIMSEWEFRPCFWVSTVLQCVAAMVDIIMVKRWNTAIGIPDKVMYMLGNNIVATVVDMLHFMPGVVLISKLCPKGLESTLYALLAGFSNFGSQVARAIGTFLIPVFGISMKQNGPCVYDNLPILIAIAHILVPLITIPATFVLLPKARLTDPLFPDQFHAKYEEEENETDVALDSATGNADSKK